MVKTRKGASLALYLSIWLGLILVGIFIGGAAYTSHLEEIHGVTLDPVDVALNLIKESFANPRFWIFTGVTTLVMAGLILASGGSGFAVLYIFPLIMVFGLLSQFALPQSLITGEQYAYANLTLEQGLPESSPTLVVLQYAITIFFGILTVLTLFTFTSGRG